MIIEHEIHQMLAQRGFGVTGNEYRYFCVRGHDSKTPSLHVNYQKGVFHCFGCGWSGTLRTLAEELGLLDAAIDANTTTKLREIWMAARPLEYNELMQLSAERAIRYEILAELDIRHPPSFAQEFADYILFPIHNMSNKFISFVGYLRRKANNKPKYKNPVGAPSFPFGLPSLRKYQSEDIFVVEGVFDALSAWEWGYSAVALLGAQNHKGLNYLQNSNGALYLAPDFDKSGQQALYKWATYAVLHGFRKVFAVHPLVEMSSKDFNDLHRSGLCIDELIRRQLVAVTPAPLYLVERAKENNENVNAVLFFLLQALGETIADIIPFLRKEFANLLLLIMERSNKLLANAEKAAGVFSQLTERDYLILVVAATTIAGRRAIASYFLPTEVERLFAFVPLFVYSSNYIPLFSEREVMQAARRFANIYRRTKGNALLNMASFLRNLSFYTVAKCDYEEGGEQ